MCDEIKSLRDDVDRLSKSLDSVLKCYQLTDNGKRSTRPRQREVDHDEPPVWFKQVLEALDKINSSLGVIGRRDSIRTPLPDRPLPDRLPGQPAVSAGHAHKLPGLRNRLEASNDHGACVNATTNTDTTSSSDPILSFRAPTEPGDPIILERHQLGKRMPETLCTLSQMPGHIKVRAPWLPEMIRGKNVEKVVLLRDNPDVKYNIFRRRQDGGVNVFREDPEEGRDFKWPKFEGMVESPRMESPLQELEKRIKNPPKATPYYCGPVQSKVVDLGFIWAGKELTEIEELTHANEPYGHIGWENSATACHTEDMGLWSVNFHLWGCDRLWLIIKSEHTERFESWVRQHWDCKPCPQFIRHLNMFFGPKQLEDAGIGFDIHTQQPGDGIVLLSGQYHQLWNLGPCLAVSTNVSKPGETLSFFREWLPVCNEDGFSNLYGDGRFLIKWVDPNVPPPGSNGLDDTTSTKLKRNASQYVPTPNKRRKFVSKRDWLDAVPAPRSKELEWRRVVHRTPEEEEIVERTTRLDKIKGQVEKGRLVILPTLSPYESMADDVPRLVSAILSRDAIKQFVEAVKHSKKPPKDQIRKPLHELSLEEGDPAFRPMAERSKQMNETHERSEYNQINHRHDQLRYAENYQALRDERNVLRLPSSIVDEVCRMSKSTPQRNKDRNKAGSKWREVCKKLGAGLLAFIPCCAIHQSPFSVTSANYVTLADKDKSEDLQRFHDMLDIEYIHSICAVAQAWFRAVDDGKQFDPNDISQRDNWDDLTGDQIVTQLKELIKG